MGEMADYYQEQDEIRYYEWMDWFESQTDEDLYKMSSKGRSEKLKSIRQYYKTHNKLSPKQRYFLAIWIDEHYF